MTSTYGDYRSCHCGKPISYGYDGDPTHHRGMCAHCDAVRCDAYPGSCEGRRSDDYDTAARRYAAGLLRDEAERLRDRATEHEFAPDFASLLRIRSRQLEFAAGWLEAGA